MLILTSLLVVFLVNFDYEEITQNRLGERKVTWGERLYLTFVVILL